MTAIVSAITHDLDHPGVNQAFLIATSNHLATLYNVRHDMVWTINQNKHHKYLIYYYLYSKYLPSIRLTWIIHSDVVVEIYCFVEYHNQLLLLIFLLTELLCTGESPLEIGFGFIARKRSIWTFWSFSLEDDGMAVEVAHSSHRHQ